MFSLQKKVDTIADKILAKSGTPTRTAPSYNPAAMPDSAIEAYNSGNYTEEQYVSTDKAIKAGLIKVPEGIELLRPVTLKSSEGASLLPQAAIDRYKTDRTEEGDKFRIQTDQAIRDGFYKAPEGLVKPAPRSAIEYAEMGAGAANKGIASIIDLAGTPFNAAAIAGQNIVTGAANTIDKLSGGTGDKYENTPNLFSMTPARDVIDRGLASEGLTPESKAEKTISSAIENAVGFAIPMSRAGATAKNIAIDASAGALTGTVSEQTDNPLLGLTVGLGGLVTGHALASKFGEKVAKVVADTPVERVFDDAGELTDEGKQLASKAGVDNVDLRKAFEEAAETTETLSAKKADIQTAIDEALAQGLDETNPSVQQGRKAINEIDDIIDKLDKPSRELPNAKPFEDIPPQARTPEQRKAEAESLGVKLTGGKVSQNAEQIQAEEALATRDIPEGAQAKQMLEQEDSSLVLAGDKIKQLFDNEGTTALDKTNVIQEALKVIKQGAFKQVQDLYTKLSKIEKAPNLNTDKIKEQILDLVSDEKIPEATRKALVQELAKYKLAGQVSDDIGELGTYKVSIDGEPVAKLREAPKSLNLANAQKLKQAINDMYVAGGRNPQLKLLQTIDDAVASRLEEVSKTQGKAGELGQQAQIAYKEFKANEGSDLVNKLIADINPDKVMRTILESGKNNVINLKKIKTLLLSSKTPEGKLAWEAIKQHTIVDIVDKGIDATTGNVNVTKLSNAIAKIGKEKLEILLSPKEYNELMKYRRVAYDVNKSKGLVSSVKDINSTLRFLASSLKTLASIGGYIAYHATSFVAGQAIKTADEVADAKQVQETLKKMFDADITDKVIKEATKPIVSKEELNQVLQFFKSEQFLGTMLKGAALQSNNKD